MIRIMMATGPKFITITVDGELAGECVDAVETCATQAAVHRRPIRLFLRDVSEHRRARTRSAGPPGGEGCSLACDRSLLLLHRCKNQSIRCVDGLCWTAEVRKNSGTCLGRRRHG